MNLYIILSLMLLFIYSVNGYASGPGSSACTTLLPGHNSAPSSNTSPFSVTVSTTSYSAGSTVQVTLRSICSQKFHGFLVQARRADNSSDRSTPVGTFTAIPGKAQAFCTASSSIAHVADSPMDELTVTWTAPSPVAGHIVFKATFVSSPYTLFWDAITSEPVLDGVSAALQLADDSQKTPVLDASGCSTSSPPTVGKFQKNNECGSTRGCFSDCDTTGCTFEASWVYGNGPNALFTIKASSTNTGTFYAALGFSSDKKMGSDSVIECVHDNGNVDVFSSYNNGRSNNRNTDPKKGISLVSSSYQNNILQCEFNREKTGQGDAMIVDISNKNYFLFFSQGPASSSGVGKHTVTPPASSAEVDLKSTTDITAVPQSRNLVITHGVMMVYAWIISASIGLIIARYFKPIWPEKKLCGEKVWFAVHRSCMVTTLLLTVISFIIIFVDVEGWAVSPVTVQQAHPYLGVIVTLLTIINPIMAIFRPHPGTANRYIFNWAHWVVGTLAYVLGVITVTIGTRMDRAQSHEHAVWVVVGFIVWQLIVVLAFEIIHLMSNKEKTDSYELQGGPTVQTTDKPAKVPGSTLKIAVLIGHGVVVAAFGFAIIILICT